MPPVTTAYRVAQRYAIVVLYHATDGADWDSIHPPEHRAGRPTEVDRGGSQRRGLGADPNNADEFAQTALHAMAELIGGDKSTREGVVVAANTLVGVGASSSRDVHGNTPLESVLKQIRHHADFDGALGLHWQPGRDDEKEVYELVLALLDPTQHDALICGVLTPCQDHRLRFYTETNGDSSCEVPEF